MLWPQGFEGFIKLDSDLEAKVRREMRAGDVTDPLLNLLRAAIAAHEHSFHFPKLSKESFLAFMSDCWDGGINQYEVATMQKEGSYNNEVGVALNLACHLSLFGKKKDLLPQ